VTKRKKKRNGLNRGIEDFIDQARKLEEGGNRKQHIVPRSYLSRWSENDQIRVTETSTPKSFVTSPAKAIRETDFYRAESPDIDPDMIPPLFFEKALGELEGRAQPAFEVLISGDPRDLNPRQALDMGNYLGVQSTRGRSVRTQIQQASNAALSFWLDSMPDHQISQMLKSKGTEATPESVANARIAIDALSQGKIVASPQKPELIARAMEMGLKLWPYFLARRWRVYHTNLDLITCDEPVVMIGGPGSDRRRVAGHATARAAIFPLDPHHLLAMFHPDLRLDESVLRPDLDPSELGEINREVAANSHKWCMERPTKHQTESISLPISSKLTTTRTFKVPKSQNDQALELSRSTRWASSPTPPPWPIRRWWKYVRPDSPDSLPFNPEEMDEVLFNTL